MRWVFFRGEGIYLTLVKGNGIAAARVTLQTGRKHQIRAHLHEPGVSIIGDRMYGKFDNASRMMLAALLLEFDHPIALKRMKFEIPAPNDFPLLSGKKLSECD